MTKWERRIRRERKQKYRKLGPSPATLLEDTQVVMCVKYSTMTEAEGAEALRVRIEEFNTITKSVILEAYVAVEKLAKESPCQPN